MASTKIINVLKDDSFQEILEIFKTTPANEVIFVLPMRAKSFSKEAHFSDLREEADNVDKTVSFLCSNPDVNEMAKSHGFEVLLAKPTARRESTKSAKAPSAKKNSINIVNEIEEFYQVPVSEPEPSHHVAIKATKAEVLEEPIEESLPEVAEPVAMPVGTRRMAEVMPTDDGEHVKIRAPREKTVELDVHHDVAAENEDQTQEVESMWRSDFTATKNIQPSRSLSSWFTRKPKPQSVLARSTPQRSQSRHTRVITTLAIATVLVLGTVIFVTTGSAKVAITPKSQPVDVSLPIVASDAVASINSKTLQIPGQVFTVEKTVTQIFDATGHKDVAQKARGAITISNATNTSQSLIATTRFESSDGHIFHTLTNVLVPPAKNSTTPGIATVQLIADKSGSDFNVPAGKFTIPAFKEKGDTVKYQNITGTSTDAMHGGTSGQANVVTQADFDAAVATLTSQLKDVITGELTAQTNGLKVVNSSQISIAKPVSTANVDDAADTFTVNLKGSIMTVGFKESDVQTLVAQYIDTKYNLHVEQNKITQTYTDTKFDSATHALSMNVAVKGVAYAKVDESHIIADLLGKNDQAIKDYLSTAPGINTANVVLSPLWVRSIPHDSSKVHVNFTY